MQIGLLSSDSPPKNLKSIARRRRVADETGSDPELSSHEGRSPYGGGELLTAR
jgi:hypothetical protein